MWCSGCSILWVLLDIWEVPSSAADLKSWGFKPPLLKEQLGFELPPGRGPRVGVGRWGFVVRLCPSLCYPLPCGLPLVRQFKGVYVFYFPEKVVPGVPEDLVGRSGV